MSLMLCSLVWPLSHGVEHARRDRDLDFGPELLFERIDVTVDAISSPVDLILVEVLGVLEYLPGRRRCLGVNCPQEEDLSEDSERVSASIFSFLEQVLEEKQWMTC
uniref:Uncharacterized protein n=1 Tax=Helicotheca tamesis TaxID=374047 RepID=A0A7S2HMA7_9STRA|mmetsp:Transcript_19427/g.26672  ORF Transcript_19427/g.26672 Transcript_19427/m.26672 type:complete len:106 (+) Transcript_19427:526-843(+)